MFNGLSVRFLLYLNKGGSWELAGYPTKCYSFLFIIQVQGVRDLFWLPIEQYQKDGRIVRGLQRGANSFTTSTAMAALELTTRLIHLIQVSCYRFYL